ncbi:MAG: hypothetical protein GXP37_05495 [Chloroflexi bacterium]|nr:hypothetical protein [Chloroflexota bacterium]
MLPTGHLEWTWAGLNLAQRTFGWFPEADYRKVALMNWAPDLIDKPLALFVFPNANAALFFGHTLLLHVFLWTFAWATGRLRTWGVYLAAFSAHLLEDRMWGFTQTLLWPLRGWSWHQWRHVGSVQEMLHAYTEIVLQEPILIVFEVLGLMLLAWFVVDRDLLNAAAWRQFLLTGRPEGALAPVEVRE